MGIKENYSGIQDKIPGARIIAVSKYVNSEKIIEAYQAGIKDFGENKIQDAEKKRAELPEEINKNINWHFLGHLQTNKVKKVAGNYEYIHSVDSFKLAESLSKEASSKGIKQKILLQVNIAEEKTKYGFKINEIKEIFKEILNLESLEIIGLMTMAPFTKDRGLQKSVFKGLKDLRNYLETEYKVNIPELSMGMSNDYTTACEEGSTMVRIGQAIFG
ncbi:MAG TPA: YggS family pyridoxal phosphate-dependent enzyme [Candidatus Gastranaerophilales bacterium]|nr:YggS family pyridoxal phosphate-dependent enzyme [Candidatus Gastranaerophilales bacterium]